MNFHKEVSYVRSPCIPLSPFPSPRLCLFLAQVWLKACKTMLGADGKGWQRWCLVHEAPKGETYWLTRAYIRDTLWRAKRSWNDRFICSLSFPFLQSILPLVFRFSCKNLMSASTLRALPATVSDVPAQLHPSHGATEPLDHRGSLLLRPARGGRGLLAEGIAGSPGYPLLSCSIWHCSCFLMGPWFTYLWVNI